MATFLKMPEPRVKDIHSHQCPKCAHIWRHDTWSKKTVGNFLEAHTCPKCRHAPVTVRYISRRAWY